MQVIPYVHILCMVRLRKHHYRMRRSTESKYMGIKKKVAMHYEEIAKNSDHFRKMEVEKKNLPAATLNQTRSQ